MYGIKYVRTTSFAKFPGMSPRGTLVTEFLSHLNGDSHKYRREVFGNFYTKCWQESGEKFAEAQSREVLPFIALLTEKEAKGLWKYLVFDWDNASKRLKGMTEGRDNHRESSNPPK
ncbi:hypothetical protein A2415_00920 [candidate division WWE3 bacterium RIFOXYC1_FULL_39_7]|uniref:Uncharacterized protein n=2 Tax=Katanobacteria TaxID=422282 RepID=A0A1F4X702_UNCKA|nr:MAG: hypothetical protein A2415_00920 [candidate division WWE3 bacterium RIFOXYC1_FULL_39_7]OGC77447.1 MAG: hypothetical protein A2619_03810 [candidate division WWE3 bacterium RIFOXYD1_FULL_39_9]